MKPALIVLMSAFIGAGLLGCGDTHAVGNTVSNAAVANNPSSDNPAAIRIDREHQFGDYDDDDYYDNARHHDGDADDSDRTKDGDGDYDNSGSGYYDSDDNSVRRFGHMAPTTEAQTIVALVKRYYRAAAAGNGAQACALVYAPLAKTFPEDLAQAGPYYLRGSKTCPIVVSKLFKQNHLQLSTYAARLQISDVRILENLGLVVMRFKGLPGRYVEVIRAHGSWWMYSLLDNEMP